MNEAHLINSVGLVVVDDTYLTRIGELHHLGLLDINDVLDRQRDLDAVTFIVTSEDDTLETLHPLLCTWGTIGAEVVGAMACHDLEVEAVLVFVDDAGGDAITEVDLAVWEVEVGGVSVVREHVAFQAEPVAVELGIPLAALGEVA